MRSDIEICQASQLQPIQDIARKAGLLESEFTPLGEHKAKLKHSALVRLAKQARGKLIQVSAITPTPLGEGKTVTTIGLSQGLAKLGKSVMACIRQPSMGPVFGVKGGAAGGGYSQVAPMDQLNLHLTGDIHAVTAAHNLAAAALDARIYHEQRHGYQEFEQKTGLSALRIDMQQIVWKRVVDHNDRALRMITVGKNEPGKTINGLERDCGFDISAASELMAILALSGSLQDMRERIGKIVLAYNLDGEPVTTEDLQVAGAMAVTLREALDLEGVPTLIHTGPFANIAHGNSSVLADQLATALAEYTVTEGGFGSDMGLEKACNIKAQQGGQQPDCAVIVATLRGLKANSGLVDMRPGMGIPEELLEPNLQALEAGFANLQWHIENARKYGLPVVVAINRFPQDSVEELTQLQAWVAALGVGVALSEAFAQGGEGALELAKQVERACEQQADFSPLYCLSENLRDKLNRVAIQGYGAKGIELSEQASQQLVRFAELGFDKLAVCLAKTPLSISHDPSLKGAPSGFTLPIRELKLCAGAGFVYALCGKVMTMPGLPEKPAYMNLDINAEGEVVGLS